MTGEQVGSVDRFATDAPLYQHIATLADLRETHPALESGAQIERYADDGAGVYAFSRVDRDEKIEYLVATNSATTDRTVSVPTLTTDAAFTPLYGGGQAFTTDATGVASVTVPALSSVVFTADGQVTAPAEATALTVAVPEAGAALTGLAPVSADIADAWAETSFAWRVVGDDEWTPLGTAEDTTPRVFHDVAPLAAGTLVEYRAVSTDAAGTRSAASTYASVGNGVTTVPDEPEEPESPVEPEPQEATPYTYVSVPGSFNSEVGLPRRLAAGLRERADGEGRRHLAPDAARPRRGLVHVQDRDREELGRELRRRGRREAAATSRSRTRAVRSRSTSTPAPRTSARLPTARSSRLRARSRASSAAPVTGRPRAWPR